MKRWAAALVAAVVLMGGIPLLVLLASDQPCGAAAPVTAGGGGTKGETAVWQALRAAGFDTAHAAGAMGNMKAESGFDAQIVQGGGHSTRPSDAGSLGYGLVQWTPGRKLSDYIGTATPTVANEVATLKAQLDGQGPHSEKAAGDAFWAATDVASVARVFHLRYERSASTDSTARVRSAMDIYTRLQGLAAPAGSAAMSLSNQPAAAASGTCTGLDATVATWNVYVHNSTANMAEGAKRITAAGADEVGFQELASRARRDAVAAAIPDYYLAGIDGSTPIALRRSKYTVLSEKAVLILPPGMAFEGPRQGGRWMTIAQVQDRQSGQVVTFINTHMLPRVQKHGKLNEGWPRRIAAYRKQLRAVIGAAEDSRAAGPVVVTGDFNFNGDPDGAFTKAGMVASWQVLGHDIGGTRSRDIDQVWSFGATASAQKIVTDPGGSDHNPRLVLFVAAVGAAGGGPVPASFNQQGNPRTVEQAISWMQANMPGGAPGEPVQGACERYMNLAYGLGGGYPTALAHWNAAGPKTTGTGVPPRGALVFIRSHNPAGHVILSIGNGQAISTDYANGHYAPGKIGSGSVADIAAAMGGPVLGWRAPNFRIGSEAA